VLVINHRFIKNALKTWFEKPSAKKRILNIFHVKGERLFLKGPFSYF